MMRWESLAHDRLVRLVSKNVHLFVVGTLLVIIAASGLLQKAQAATTNVDALTPFISCQESDPNSTVTEGDKAANFVVAINGFTETEYSYATVDGTASSIDQSDFIAQSGILQFDTNDTRQHMAYVSVPITNDNVPEPTENFDLAVYSNIDGQVLETSCTATILDDDPEVIPTPPPTITPTPTPPPTPTPTTTPAPMPPVRHATVVTIPDPTPTPTPEPEPTPIDTPEVLGTSTIEAPPQTPPSPAVPERAAFVKAVPTPQDLKPTAKRVIRSLLIAGLLVLLIMFPADLFNSTLQSNYDEIIGWFKMDYIGKLHQKMRLHRVPIAIVLSIFAGLVTLLNTQLSPGFGFNRASGALLLGMFIALTFAATVYDVSRAWYLKKRFGISGKLRAHALGLGVGALFVTVSRLAHFVPGYLYGLFTGLIFKQKSPTDEQDGEGLALASVIVLVFAIIGWFGLIPVRHAATQSNASFMTLTFEAALATLWVSALGMIVFSLAPLRFMYGEQVKKWNKYVWGAIYGIGMLLFVYTLLDPNQSVYGKSSTASWIAVLGLFIGFGIFSFGFWGYFRYRPTKEVAKELST